MNLNEERGNLLAENAGLSAKLRESRAENRRLAAEVARLRDTLAEYANPMNWGYYDGSGCPKGHGRYEDVCFIGPEAARRTLESSDA
jgi:hypothetical protein